MAASRPLLLVAGIAPGLGASIASAFAGVGYDVLGLARSDRAAREIDSEVASAGGQYAHLCCDLTRPADVAAALGPYAGRISVVIHNAHVLSIKPFDQSDEQEFETLWRVICHGAMIVSKQVLPGMIAAGHGAIILTGATASMRGYPKFAAFASAKFALRGLAQSLAREFGPAGVHVAHVIIDGLIDEPQTDHRFGTTQSVRIDPDAAARMYLNLVAQDRSCWTHELDLRPFAERY